MEDLKDDPLEEDLYDEEDITDVELDFNKTYDREYQPDLGEQLSDFLDEEENRGRHEIEDNES